MRCRTVQVAIACGETQNTKKEAALQAHLIKCDRCRAFAGRCGKMKEAVHGIEHPEPAETLVLRILALCDADPLRRHSSYRPLLQALRAVLLGVLGLLAIITLGWTIRVMAGISLGEPISMEQMTALAYVFQNIVMVSLMPLLLRRRKKAPAPLRVRSSGTAGMALMI